MIADYVLIRLQWYDVQSPTDKVAESVCEPNYRRCTPSALEQLKSFTSLSFQQTYVPVSEAEVGPKQSGDQWRPSCHGKTPVSQTASAGHCVWSGT